MAVGCASTALVQLSLGDARVEVSAGDCEDFEALNAKVGVKFSLHPGSFSIFGGFGKVDGAEALQRAIDMAGGGLCILEVREAPEWQKIREMEARINVLVARCPMVDSALMSVEERSSRRFEKLAAAVQAVDEQAMLRAELARAEVRHGLETMDAKVSRSIAPLLQCVALEQMELKGKLDSLGSSLLFEETNAKINCGIAPMLQAMALQQMELKSQLDSLQLCSPYEQPVDSLREKVDEMGDAMKDLTREMGVKSQQMKALQDELRNFGQQTTLGGRGYALSAAQQDLGKPPKTIKNDLGGPGYDGDSYAQWLEGSPMDLSSPFTFSKKSLNNSLNIGGAAAVPFARFVAPRHLDRLQASRSLPHLPPVK